MFVDVLADLREITEFTNQNKIAVPIGIYGSFNHENVAILQALKDYLKTQGFIVFLSTDLMECCPQPEGMEWEEYSNRISELLRRVCHLHIVFIFNNRGAGTNINESVAMELQAMSDMNIGYVKIFYEHGSIEQTKAILHGLLQRRKKIWPQDSFDRYKDMQSIFKLGFSFCYDRIFNDPAIMYNIESVSDYKLIVSKLCREVMR